MIQAKVIEKSGMVQIPRGVCVTTEGFEEQLRSSSSGQQLMTMLREVEQVAWKKDFQIEEDRRKELEEVCQR